MSFFSINIESLCDVWQIASTLSGSVSPTGNRGLCFSMRSVRSSVINNGYSDTVLCRSLDNDLQRWHYFEFVFLIERRFDICSLVFQLGKSILDGLVQKL